MAIIPIRDNVLIRQDPPKEKLESGLYLPQGSRELYGDFGTVIAVGPGRVIEGGRRVEPSVKPGDRVLFKRRPASALNRDGNMKEWENLLMLKDDDLLAVIEES